MPRTSSIVLLLLLLLACCVSGDELHHQQHARIRGLVHEHLQRSGRELGPMRVLVCGLRQR